MQNCKAQNKTIEAPCRCLLSYKDKYYTVTVLRVYDNYADICDLDGNILYRVPLKELYQW